MKFEIKITQVFKVTRTIIVGIRAEDRDSAESQADYILAPAFANPNWKSHWDLQNEEVEVQ